MTDVNIIEFSNLTCPEQLETLVRVGYPALMSYCHSGSELYNDESLWKQLYTKDFSSIPVRDGTMQKNYLRTYQQFHKFADEFTKENSQGDPKYVSYKLQADGVIETIQDYFRSLDPTIVEKWRAWANLRDPEYRHLYGGDLFSYDEKLAEHRDRLAFKLLKIMWAVDKATWKWIENIPHVNFGDDVCNKADDVENFVRDLFVLRVD